MKKSMIYKAAGTTSILLLLAGCTTGQNLSAETASAAAYPLPEETKVQEISDRFRTDGSEAETAETGDVKTKTVKPEEALTEVFNSLYRGSSWYDKAVLHTEYTPHPYYMGEILLSTDGTVITDTDIIADFWNMYPQMSLAREAAEDDSWRELYQFGHIEGQENRYLQYSGLATNEKAYIFRLYIRIWEDIYSDEYEEKIENFYAYIRESGDIVPMFLYRGQAIEKFNERYAEVTAPK